MAHGAPFTGRFDCSEGGRDGAQRPLLSTPDLATADHRCAQMFRCSFGCSLTGQGWALTRSSAAPIFFFSFTSDGLWETRTLRGLVINFEPARVSTSKHLRTSMICCRQIRSAEQWPLSAVPATFGAIEAASKGRAVRHTLLAGAILTDRYFD